MLEAHKKRLIAQSNTLRALHRVGKVTDGSAEAADIALAALMPWVFKDVSDATLRATFEDMMVAWYRAMGNFPGAEK